MRNLLLVAVLMLSFCVLAVAQEVPQYEIFGGWSFDRADGGEETMNGWNASITINVNEFVGVAVDGNGLYRGSANSYSLMFGPRFKIRQNEKVAPFYHAMMGVIESSYSNDSNSELDYSTTSFALLFGGGLDVKVNERISVRPFQADYVLERSYGDFTPSLRFGAGVVINIGER